MCVRSVFESLHVSVLSWSVSVRLCASLCVSLSLRVFVPPCLCACLCACVCVCVCASVCVCVCVCFFLVFVSVRFFISVQLFAFLLIDLPVPVRLSVLACLPVCLNPGVQKVGFWDCLSPRVSLTHWAARPRQATAS